MMAKQRRDVKAVQRAEKSATDFAISQSTVTEVAEGFLRNMEIKNDAFNKGCAQEVYSMDSYLDGLSELGRTMEEFITIWLKDQEKRKQDFDVLDEIAHKYKGSDLIEWIRQGKTVMQYRSDAVYYPLADAACREREVREGLRERIRECMRPCRREIIRECIR